MTAPLTEYFHDGLTFEVTENGPPGGRAVIMLHGFPEDRHCWSALSGHLTEAGFRVLAPEQRGYSPEARPMGRKNYTLDLLSSDVLALADSAGVGRFDVVGHDWGSLVAWDLAARHHERVRSLCALSVPHPQAFRRAMTRSSQALHSWYMAFFQVPRVPERLLAARGGHVLASSLVRSGLDQMTAERYAARAANAEAMSGPINWYRALPFVLRKLPGPVNVPTLFVWGDRERYVSRAAAQGCVLWVAAQYRFVVLPGRTHWLPTTAAGEIAPLLIEHLSSVPSD